MPVLEFLRKFEQYPVLDFSLLKMETLKVGTYLTGPIWKYPHGRGVDVY